MIGIVDYRAGNIASVSRALKALKEEHIVSSSPAVLGTCQKIIFPGVGEASYAMSQLEMLGLDVFLKDFAKSGLPLLGICLGSQVLFDYSAEGNTQCLGLLEGTVQHFSKVWQDNGIPPQNKIPHIGWNNITLMNGGHPLLSGLENTDFYFVHSYIVRPADDSVIRATADYGLSFPACVAKDNICAFQFHPEKSGKAGLHILKRFIDLDDFEGQKEMPLC